MIIFENKGVIDPLSITTFGVSAKANENVIGYFGTGLKYAIAVLLREEQSITINSNNNVYVFDVEQFELRDKSFGIVRMNGEKLGFTTELGKNWEPEHAFRELYCNAIDEQGCAYAAEPEQDEAVDTTGCTRITVKGRLFERLFHDELPSIVLQGAPIKSIGTSVALYPSKGNAIYYRRVRVSQTGLPTRYAYNMLFNVSLTEDRTIKLPSTVWKAFAKAVAEECEDAKLLKEILTAPRGEYHEASIDYDWSDIVPSQLFMDMISTLREDRGATINPSAVALWRKHAGVTKQFEQMQMTRVQETMLERAVQFCRRIGFKVDDYPIIIVNTLGDHVLGLAEDDKIYIAERVLKQGTKQLAATLIEEFIHLRHKLHDETRDLELFLFDCIVSLGEELRGEPL